MDTLPLDEPAVQPFFHELTYIHPGNALYQSWLRYILSLSREDVLEMARSGLTYQVRSLKHMIKELVAGNPVPQSLYVKLHTLGVATAKKATELRGV